MHLKNHIIMELQVGKNYRVIKDIFDFEIGEIWLLADKGYQVYYGERNFVFVNTEKSCSHIVLRDASEEDMEIYCHLDRYFEGTGKYHIQPPQR